jgi:hypothetical protein
VVDEQLRREHTQNAALALDGDPFDVSQCGADDVAVEAAGVLVSGAGNPLGTDAGLAEAAPGHKTRLSPITVGWYLVRARGLQPPDLPLQEGDVLGGHVLDQGLGVVEEAHWSLPSS